jgi:hypothetical protein
VHVGEDKEGIDSTDVHIIDFDPKTSIVKHLFTHLNDKSRFRDVISSEEEPRS